MSLKFGKLAFQ